MLRRRLLFSAVLLLAGFDLAAKPRIAILNVELNDVTLQANTPEERQRTAGIRPLFEQALLQNGNYEIVSIDGQAQTSANAGFGYLFAHADAAAELGRQFGADWVLVGQHGKPSFLYSDLMMRLIDVKNQRLAASYGVELKGNHGDITQRAIDKLAAKFRAYFTGRIESP